MLVCRLSTDAHACGWQPPCTFGPLHILAPSRAQMKSLLTRIWGSGEWKAYPYQPIFVGPDGFFSQVTCIKRTAAGTHDYIRTLNLQRLLSCAGSGRLQGPLMAWRTTYTSGCAASMLLSTSCFEGCWSQSLCMHRCTRSVHLNLRTGRCMQAQTLPACVCQAAAGFVSGASMLENTIAQRPLGQAQAAPACAGVGTSSWA